VGYVTGEFYSKSIGNHLMNTNPSFTINLKCTLFTMITLSSVLYARASTITFSDGTFDLSNYSVISVFKTNPAATVSFNQCPSCGNPGQALQVNITLPSFSDLAGVALINNSFSYNPQTQGTITTIDASVDKNLINNSISAPGTSILFVPLVEQNGKFYLDLISGPVGPGGTGGYKTLTGTGLVASDFEQLDFTTGTLNPASHPDFAGSQLLFGLEQATGQGESTITNVAAESDLDNLTFSIHSSVPDSGATLCLLLVSLAVLLVCRRALVHRTT
jgi:hypothetical protein